MKLLSETHRHPKIVKNGKVGVYTSILHIAPAIMSGYEVCPNRTKGCTAACLNEAGFQYQRKYDSRIAKTKMFFEQREAFMTQLVREIRSAVNKADRLEMSCGIRLNATSDIKWENIEHLGRNLMTIFPDVFFYDYSKIPDRKNLPANYRLTFSRSEDNHADCIKAVQNGMNVSAVFKGDLPATAIIGGQQLRVIDGDVHDFRYGDYDEYPNERVIVGLRAKGTKAKKDRSGFVIGMEHQVAA